jgi:phospholipid/cholesterol/gamma-HCH transport system substrate-binding protein
MKMHYSHQLTPNRIAQIVGAFVLVPLLVLVLAGIFMAKAEHLFDRKYLLVSSLSKSYGLEPGAPVVVSGIRIGRVEQVDLNERGTVNLVLRLLVRYRNMVKQDSELAISKSGIVVGQTQIEITGGTVDSPVLQNGATIRAIEPKDIGEIINEIQPVLAAVKQTLLRVDTITQDVQGAVKAGGRALEQVATVTQELPGLVASVQRTAASVERTVDALPDMTGSVKRMLGVMDRVTTDVHQATRRLPVIIDSTQDVLQSVKTLTSSVNDMSQELTPTLRTAQTTLADISLLVRGAKQTFPFSRFAQNAGPAPTAAEGSSLKSLRTDGLSSR